MVGKSHRFRSEIAHIDLVIGPRGGPVEIGVYKFPCQCPDRGVHPLLAVLEPNVQTKPVTLYS